jgi:hypothetical protein
MTMIGGGQNRWRTSPSDLRQQIDEHLTWLQQRVGELDRELVRLVRANGACRRSRTFFSRPQALADLHRNRDGQPA